MAMNYQFNTKTDKVAFSLVLIGIAFLPFSRSVDNLIFVGALLSLFGGQWQARWEIIRSYKLTWATLLLLGIFALSIVYQYLTNTTVGVPGLEQSSQLMSGLSQFEKYAHKIFGMLLLIPLFVCPQRRHYAWQVLIATALLASLLVTLHQFSIINLQAIFHKNSGHIIGAIPLSIMVALVMMVCFDHCVFNKTRRWLYAGLALLFFIYLFYINIERTGMLLAGACFIPLWLYLRLQGRQQAVGLSLFVMTMVVIYLSSPSMGPRFHKAMAEAKAYTQVSSVEGSSIGLRLAFARHSLALFKQKPWLGYGLGAFAAAYSTTGGPMIGDGSTTLGDPHNMYLHIAVQLGLVGLVSLLCWLSIAALEGLTLSDRYLVGCVWLSLTVAGLFIETLVLNQTCYLYTTFMALCLASRAQVKDVRGSVNYQ